MSGASSDGSLFQHRVLASSLPATSRLSLYVTMRSQHQPKMRALVDEATRLAGEGLLDVTFGA